MQIVQMRTDFSDADAAIETTRQIPELGTMIVQIRKGKRLISIATSTFGSASAVDAGGAVGAVRALNLMIDGCSPFCT